MNSSNRNRYGCPMSLEVLEERCLLLGGCTIDGMTNKMAHLPVVTTGANHILVVEIDNTGKIFGGFGPRRRNYIDV